MSYIVADKLVKKFGKGDAAVAAVADISFQIEYLIQDYLWLLLTNNYKPLIERLAHLGLQCPQGIIGIQPRRHKSRISARYQSDDQGNDDGAPRQFDAEGNQSRMTFAKQ